MISRPAAMSSEFGVMSSEKKDIDEKFDFEDLLVYQKSLEYVDFIYKITANFPSAGNIWPF